jgi:hypothetical protein
LNAGLAGKINFNDHLRRMSSSIRVTMILNRRAGVMLNRFAAPLAGLHGAKAIVIAIRRASSGVSASHFSMCRDFEVPIARRCQMCDDRDRRHSPPHTAIVASPFGRNFDGTTSGLRH